MNAPEPPRVQAGDRYRKGPAVETVLDVWQRPDGDWWLRYVAVTETPRGPVEVSRAADLDYYLAPYQQRVALGRSARRG